MDVRKTKLFAFASAAALLLSAAPAMGQTPTPYSVTRTPKVYQPLPHPDGGQVQSLNSGEAVDTSFGVTLPFPVTFFDETYAGDELSVGSNGIVTFGPRSTASCSSGQPHCANTWNSFAIPDSSKTPSRLIAVWWFWQRCPSGTIRTQVVGAAPARALVIEWNGCKNWSSSTDAWWEAQVWLYEGSSTIEVHYGDTWGSNTHPSDYVVGITDKGVAHYGLANGCNKTCGQTDWPTNQVITYSQGPELRTERVEGELEGFAGIPMTVRATVANVGGEIAENFAARLWVSPTPSLADAEEWVTLDGDLRSILPGEKTTFETTQRLPLSLEAGRYYVLFEADPFHVVPVSSRSSTVGVFGPFEVGIRAANLTVGRIDVPEKVTPGETIEVRWQARNTGNLGTQSAPYRIVLSDSTFVSPGDPSIGEGVLGEMGMDSEMWESTQAVVPADVRPGLYYVGVHVDPDRAVFEHDRLDNARVSSPVVVSTEELVVVTQELPEGQVGGHYSVRLVAFGGDGHHVWHLGADSTLPPGLSLISRHDAQGGTSTFLEGIPASTGVFTFSLEVASAGQVVLTEYQLEIGHGDHGLSVTTGHLARGAFGFRYEDHLGAIGGIPPYTWVAQTTLPRGILLRSDGFLSGTPEQDGTYTVRVVVEDTTGQRGSKELQLEISPPHHLTCVTKELPPLRIGESVRFELVAAGGVKDASGGYTWLLGDTVQMATELGVAPRPSAGPPPGLRLQENEVRGAPTMFGSFLWSVGVRDGAGGEPIRCPIRVEVPRDHGLTVVTKSLPTVVAGQSYRAHLAASGGDGELRWSEYEGGRVLSDLGLSFDGAAIVGTPSLDFLAGEQEKIVSLLVLAEDEKGRIGYGPLSLRIVAKAPSQAKPQEKAESGCQVGASAPTPWLLALMGLVLLRRRKVS